MQSYPLGYHRAARIIDKRLALVGDAAHGIHPIAGQGVNLGYRDAAALAEVIVEGMRTGMEPGDAQLLARYQRWRALDSLSVTIMMDGLVRLFDVPGRPASRVRRLGLSAVQRLGPVKERFMAEARGESGPRPRLLLGHGI
jgi:2-octaprenyl-6-methoxyphenol hydroxylase